MKTKIPYYTIIILILNLMYSCSVKPIHYNKTSIIKNYDSQYQYFIDSAQIDLKNYYLNADNIESVTVDKKTKSIHITQKETVEYLSFSHLADSMKTQQKDGKPIGFIVINGVSFESKAIDQLYFDINILNEIQILKQDIIIGC